MSIYVLRIDEPYDYTDRTLATASWWDRYIIQPGTYPITWWTTQFEVPGDTLDHAAAYAKERHSWAYPGYAQATVDAVLVESYRESRLLSATSAKREEPNRRTTKTWRPYSYEIAPGAGPYGGTIDVVGASLLDRFMAAAGAAA